MPPSYFKTIHPGFVCQFHSKKTATNKTTTKNLLVLSPELYPMRLKDIFVTKMAPSHTLVLGSSPCRVISLFPFFSLYSGTLIQQSANRLGKKVRLYIEQPDLTNYFQKNNQNVHCIDVQLIIIFINVQNPAFPDLNNYSNTRCNNIILFFNAYVAVSSCTQLWHQKLKNRKTNCLKLLYTLILPLLVCLAFIFYHMLTCIRYMEVYFYDCASGLCLL